VKKGNIGFIFLGVVQCTCVLFVNSVMGILNK